jgi:hypothetical protein
MEAGLEFEVDRNNNEHDFESLETCHEAAEREHAASGQFEQKPAVCVNLTIYCAFHVLSHNNSNFDNLTLCGLCISRTDFCFSCFSRSLNVLRPPNTAHTMRASVTLLLRGIKLTAAQK